MCCGKMLTCRKKLQAFGKSLAVIVPALWADSHGLEAHDEVELVLNDSLIIKPSRKATNRDEIR